MDNETLENGSWHVLGRAAFARENDLPYGYFGYRHIGYFNGISDAEKIIAHLLERDFLVYQRDKMGLHTWAITRNGIKEFERLRNPSEQTLTELNSNQRSLLAHICVSPRWANVYTPEDRKELARMMQCGFITYDAANHTYVATDSGRAELAKPHEPPAETAEILATIARLESELAAARARLARSDGLHEGG